MFTSRRSRPFALALATFAVLATPTATAQTVTITLGPQASQAASKLGVSTAQLKSQLQSSVAALYGVADAREYLRLSANAASLASKGLGVDYTTSFDRLVFGIGVDAAIATSESDLAAAVNAMSSAASGSFDRAVPIGAGAQLSLLAGVHLGSDPKDGDGFYLFASGLAHPLSVGVFSGTGYNLGGHVQYRLATGHGSKMLAEWGGLAITSGLEWSKATVQLTDTLDAPAPLGSGLSMLTSSKGTITITEEAITLPLELTTSVRLFYFLTLFGGAGVDVQLGQASLGLDVNSTLTGVVSSSGQHLALGTARAIYSGENGADAVLFRGLAGVELNFGPLHLFTQGTILTKDLSIGVAAGLRVGI